MNAPDLSAAVIGRLRSLGLEVHDHRPEVTQASRYAIFYGTPGRADQHRLEGGSRDLVWDCRIVCVARTPEGLRHLTTAVRDALCDWRPDPHPAASPLRDLTASPELIDGPAGDERRSATLHFRLTTRR